MDAHKGLHSTESSDIQRNNRWQSGGVAGLQLLIRHDACCVSAVVSDYTMPYSL